MLHIKRETDQEWTKPQARDLELMCARGELNQGDLTLKPAEIAVLSVKSRSRCLPLDTVPRWGVLHEVAPARF